MLTIKTTLVGLTLAAAASHGFASTNLVTNGSFEANAVPGSFINSTIQSISNWTASQVGISSTVL